MRVASVIVRPIISILIFVVNIIYVLPKLFSQLCLSCDRPRRCHSLLLNEQCGCSLEKSAAELSPINKLVKAYLGIFKVVQSNDFPHCFDVMK